MNPEQRRVRYTEMDEAQLRKLAEERGLSVQEAPDRDALIGLLEGRDQFEAAERAQTDAYGGTSGQTPDQSKLVGSTDEGAGGVRRAGEPSPPDDSERPSEIGEP